jgi:hypothetical protein
MQLSAFLTFFTALAVATASALPELQAKAVGTGQCGYNDYDAHYYCFIDEVVSLLLSLLPHLIGSNNNGDSGLWVRTRNLRQP